MKNKISILLDSGIFGLQKYGGISNYWNKLVKYAFTSEDLNAKALLPKKIINVDFIKSAFNKNDFINENLHPKISRYFKAKIKKNFQVFHSSYYRRPKNRDCLYVVSVYDFTYEYYSKGLKKIVHHNQKSASIIDADEIICISNSTRNDVLKFFPAINPNNIHVVHLAVDHNNFFPEKQKKSELKNTVLYVGERTSYKRFDLAIGAIKGNLEYKLGIVGPILNQDEKKLLNSNIPNNWEYLGQVALEELRVIYSSAFAFIYPSDYEGFGLPLLEAMACGCPVLAAKNSSLFEIGGDAALYAEKQCPKLYAKKLSDIKDCKNILVSKGLERAKMFTWEKTFNKTLSIYIKGLKRKHAT